MPATLFSFVLPSTDNRPLGIGDIYFSAAVAGHDGTGWKGSWNGSWRYLFLGLVLKEKGGQIFIINEEKKLHFGSREFTILDFPVTLTVCISVLYKSTRPSKPHCS